MVNGAGQVQRLTAAAPRSSKSALGAYLRRLCARMDKPKAVTAAAHKLARLICTMLTNGEEHTDQGQGLLRAALPPARAGLAGTTRGQARHEEDGAG